MGLLHLDSVQQNEEHKVSATTLFMTKNFRRFWHCDISCVASVSNTGTVLQIRPQALPDSHPFTIWELHRPKVKNLVVSLPMTTKTLWPVDNFPHNIRVLVFGLLPISHNHLQRKESGEVQ
jgi:hypothetical protein